MATKATKKSTPKKKVTRKTKKTQEIKNQDHSTSIMILASLGLILLIYFASNVDTSIEIKVDKNPEVKKEITSSFTLSGKSYDSKEKAREQLRFMPQSQLSEEEIRFIETYKE